MQEPGFRPKVNVSIGLLTALHRLRETLKRRLKSVAKPEQT